jgi:2-iminobutanoate/2-iminopropanoate deaminase
VSQRRIETAAAPGAIGPYSQAIAAGGLLFLSGQIALDPSSGRLRGEEAAAQARQCLANLGAVLEAAGLGFGHVVKTTLYLVDLADFEAVNRVYGEVFDRMPPARATVQVAALPRGARVEIEAIAVLEAPVSRPSQNAT